MLHKTGESHPWNTLTGKKALVLLFLLSIGLRLALLIPVVENEVPLLYDEAGYYNRALGFQRIFIDFAHFKMPSAQALAQAYGEGHWPPLHPIILGIGLSIAGSGIGVARTVVMLLSALTTVLVFLLTAKILDRRAAWFAAVIHILSPGFLAYSHFLWSETTCIFFLILGMYLVAHTVSCSAKNQTAFLAFLTGTAFGCAILTRAAVLPLVFVSAVWSGIVIEEKQRKWIAMVLTLVATVLVLFPWHLALYKAQGRFVVLTTLGGYNLALGNNPWVPYGLGSSWGHEESKAKLHGELSRLSRKTRVDWGDAGFDIAAKEIQREPGKCITRAVNRLRMVWSVNHFALRHLYGTIYPPLSWPWAMVITMYVTVSYCFILAVSLAGAILGVRRNRSIRLPVVLTVAGMAPAAMTIGMSRLHLPLLAMLLPAAGHGLAVVVSKGRLRQRILVFVLFLLCVIHVLSTFPLVLENHLHPSSYYGSSIQSMNRMFGCKTHCFDRVFLRSEAEAPVVIKVCISRGQATFTDGSLEKQLNLSSDSTVSVLTVVSRGDMPPEFTVETMESKYVARFSPVQETHWMTWQPAGVPGVYYMWACGGAVPGG